jgi:hypothetical protein
VLLWPKRDEAVDLSTIVILGILIALIACFFMVLIGSLRSFPKISTLFGFQKKIVEKSFTNSKSGYFTKSDVKLIAETAQRIVQIINESLQIANTTNNNEIKISRIRTARLKLIELKGYAKNYPFIKIDKLHEVELNIRTFEEEIENITKGTVISRINWAYYKNNDLVKGLRFVATLEITTPISVLLHHGETFSGPLSEAPIYGTEQDGIWLPEIKTWRELGVDIGELSAGESASDVGPVKDSEYIAFLIDFRKIVEGQDSIDGKVKAIKKLCKVNKQYQKYFRMINKSHEHKGDFPASFFYNQFTVIPGIGGKSAKSLFEAGIKTLDDLKNADDKTLLAASGIGTAALKKIRGYFK